MNTDVSVLIVTYNSAGVIAACLDALKASRGCSLEALVVDNSSVDDCANFIRRDFRWVRLLENDNNRGFGAANNQALPLCSGRYIFFLNPDAQITPVSLRQAITYMDKHPTVGLAGCKVLCPDGSPQDSVSHRYPGEKHASNLLASLPGEIAAVMGAAMIARTALIERLNGFDEDFFLYGEDQDLCLRVRKAGYLIGYIEDAVVAHIGGHSENGFPTGDVWRKKTNAELLFYRKHYSKHVADRIRRATLLKCGWRLFTLHFANLLAANAKSIEEKIIKYRTISRTIAERN